LLKFFAAGASGDRKDQRGKMQENSIALVTGSSSQISISEGQQIGVEVIPFMIHMNGKTYSDGVDIQPAEVYKTMRANKEMPTTSPPSIGDMYQKFKELFDRGYRQIIYLSISKKLSSEYASALSVAEKVNEKYHDRKIHVVDSEVIASPQGFLATRAAEQIKQAKTIDDILGWLEKTKKNSGLVGSLETLDYLAKGGRIGKASRFLGSLLDIIPILSLQDGEVSPLGVKRGSKEIYAAIIHIVQNIIKGYQKISLAVMHADAPEKATLLQELAKKFLQFVDIPICDVTPMFGIHVGPGAFGLGYMVE